MSYLKQEQLIPPELVNLFVLSLGCLDQMVDADAIASFKVSRSTKLLSLATALEIVSQRFRLQAKELNDDRTK